MTTEEKKKVPHWMDCNCTCHGFEADNTGCPHCQPKNWDLRSDCCNAEFDAFGFENDQGLYDEKCLKCGKRCDVHYQTLPTFPETTEEKKCTLCGAFDDGTGFCLNGHVMPYVDMPPAKFPYKFLPKTPPETGREWIEEQLKDFETKFFVNSGKIPVDEYVEVGLWLHKAFSSALAQGEKIGAEKERARLSGWLMHDDNCKGLYFDPKKTSKCDCGLADALKG